MEEENNECLKFHGYISSSGTESEVDDSKFELDEQFEAFKPPPLNINPEKHKIIVIDGTAPKNLSKSKRRRLRKKRGKLLALNGITNSKDDESSRSSQLKHCDNYLNNCDANVLEEKFPLLVEDNGLPGDKIKEGTKQQKLKHKQKNDGMEEQRKTEKLVRETKDPLLHYIDNVGNIINIMKSFVYTDKCRVNMYDIQDIDNYSSDVASILKLYYRCDLSRALERTLHYIKYCMDLAIQSNYASTKGFLCYIEAECASIIRIATLYNGFYTEYKGILREIFIIHGEKPNSLNVILLINHLSDLLCTLMKNTLNDMKRPKSTLFLVISDEEFLLLCNNLHLVVTSYVETTLQTVMLLAEAMKKTLNQKNGLPYVPRTQREPVKMRKIRLMDVSAKYIDILENNFCAFIDDFWARNRDIDKYFSCKGILTIKTCTKNVDGENLLILKSSGEDLSRPPPVIIEDMTENRKYFYDGSYQSSELLDSWRTFQSRYLNEDLGKMFSKINFESKATSMEKIDAENSLNDKLPIEDSSHPQVCQFKPVEIITPENRKYFYDGSYLECDSADLWKSFQSRYLNEDVSNMRSELKQLNGDIIFYNTVINGIFIPSPMKVESVKIDSSNVVEDDLNSDFRAIAKFLVLYLLLKQPWFLNLVVSFIVAEVDIIILISLLVYLSVQFVINY